MEEENEPRKKHRYTVDDVATIAMTVLGLALFLLGEFTDQVIIEVAGSTFFLAFWFKWLIEHTHK